ncbi:right-handed parallel beta-helix repeat-containing protein [Candidatus Bathyarchaeota archaeon]|nr:right-handed parallel beta-helix repeat-containing protein [Candidatus Bathyarchaeota archaeon]
MKRALSVFMFVLLLVSMLTMAFRIQPVKASGTIYIRADGSVDPPTAPIQRNGNTYTLTGSITSNAEGIVVGIDNIVVNGAGYTVQGTGGGAHGILLFRRTNVRIQGMTIKAFSEGICLDFSSGNSIAGNNIAANKHGLVLVFDCSGNSIAGNNITSNGGGIDLSYSSNYNSISGNNIAASNGAGIDLSYSSNYNSISGNNIAASNGAGIDLSYSSSNKIFHNNFENNMPQVFSPYSASIWDDGYPSGGNYWSDYTGVDLKSGPNQNQLGSDGIGDTPYTIDSNNTDHYPLMWPWGSAPSTHSVFFEESGVSNPAQVWSVTLDGYGTEYSNGPGNTIYTIIFTGVSNGGPYQFIVTPPSGFVAQPTADPITVNGGDFHQPITFTSVPVTYTFTLAAGPGGSVSYSFSLGSGTVSSGQSQQLTVPQSCQFSLTANPDSTHVFQAWSTTGSASVSNPSSASTTATVNGNGGVTANFAYNLGVSISPTSVSIQLGQSVTFTATASGGSGDYTYVWYWMQYGVTPPNGGSASTGKSNKYTFTPSSTGSCGVYVIVTDSGGNTAQSLSSSVTGVDFQLKITPKSQNVPCGEEGSFLIEIIPIYGLEMDSKVQLSRSSAPPGVFACFSSSTIEPSQTSCFTVTVLQPQTSTISFTITASTTITIGGTNVNLAHTQTVTVNTEKVVGVKSVVTLNTLNVIPNAVALTLIGGWSGLIPGPYYGSVPTSEAFTIQQNFYVDVPAWSGDKYTPYRYWVQNVIICENFAIYGWYAIGVAEIYNATPGYIPGPIPTPEAKSYFGLPVDNPMTGHSLSLPGIYTLISIISGDQVMLSNDFFSYSWTIPAGNGRSPQNSYINAGSGARAPELVIVGAGWGSTVGFLSSTSGSVQSYVQLEGQLWASSLDELVVGFGCAATQEKSQGLNWLIGASNTATFSAQSSSTDQQGVFCIPVATSTIQDGATFENQTFLTGVSVSVSDSSAPEGTPVTITTTQIVRPTYPPGTVEVGMNPAAYYDVNVQGISDGIATVYITNGGITGQTKMQYWNGARWVEASDVSLLGNTLCGNIPVSALTGTIIAIGPIQPHDIGVVDVTPYRNWAYKGWPINISVTTTNFGTFTENETLNLFYTGVGGAGMIGSKMVVLAPSQTQVLVFSWNTTGVPPCYSGYNITALADISPEIDGNTTNNVLQSRLTVEIRILGDLSGDGKVDIVDIAIASSAFGSYPGHPRWNPIADENDDDRVDIRDIAMVCSNYGKTYM